MGLYKNIASQKIAVYAHNTSTDAPKTGDAANITAQITKDFGAAAATNDVNPTELDSTNLKGIYVFDLTQAETAANVIVISAVSGTASVALDPVQVFTDDLYKYGVIAKGRAQSATGTTLRLAAGETFADDEPIGATILITGGTTGVGQRKIILDYVASTDTATVSTWTTTPTGNIDYDVFGSAAGEGVAQTGDAYVLAGQIVALLDNARGEPAQGAPPVNPDAVTKIDYLYKFLRNKITQTATTLSVYADDAATVDHKSTVSDDGTTFTRGEIASGP